MPFGLNHLFRRRYPLAWLTLALGMACSCGLGWGLHRDAVKLDAERFELETFQLAASLEQNMERYEERLARLADYCGQFKELPTRIWMFRRQTMTDMEGNLPAVIHAVYCPKITATNFQAHLKRGQAFWKETYLFDPTESPGRDLALPVWQFWSRAGVAPLMRGTDMAIETETYPSLLPALSTARGWISARPFQVARAGAAPETGFWFGLTVIEANASWMSSLGRQPPETIEQNAKRTREYHRSVATGLLGVFISTDYIVDRAYNAPNRPNRIHIRLYADQEPNPEALFNRRSPAPVAPRHRRIIVQRWYGRSWCLEFASTPSFEAGSSRYRGWLMGGAGTGLTLLATLLVGVSLHARNRQEAMTEQIREARDALAAAQQERNKISRDLHDGTIQSLYAIQLGLGRTVEKLAAEPANARRELSGVRNELDAVIAEIRQFITAQSGAHKPVDFGAVLHALVQRARAGTTAQIELQCEPGASGRLSGDQAVHLANIAREALSNSLRHAKPLHVQMALREERETAVLEISDDGTGFDPKAPGRPGVGLTSMTARTQEMGGTLDIQSAVGRGTRITARIPTFTAETTEPEYRTVATDEA